MNRFNPHSSPQYKETVAALRDLTEAEGLQQARSAVAEALEEPLQQFFIKEYGVERAKPEQKCIARLLGGYDNCPHEEGSNNDVPHSPPYDDHSDLWLNEGRPVAYTMHVYSVGFKKLNQIQYFARQQGLKLWVAPASWYNATSCVQFEFCAPEWFDERMAST